MLGRQVVPEFLTQRLPDLLRFATDTEIHSVHDIGDHAGDCGSCTFQGSCEDSSLRPLQTPRRPSINSQPLFDVFTIRKWFNEMDEDHSGTLNRNEWLRWLRKNPAFIHFWIHGKVDVDGAAQMRARDRFSNEGQHQLSVEAKEIKKLVHIWRNIQKDDRGELTWDGFVEVFRCSGHLLEHVTPGNPRVQLAGFLKEIHDVSEPLKADAFEKFEKISKGHLNVARKKSVMRKIISKTCGIDSSDEETARKIRSFSETPTQRRSLADAALWALSSSRNSTPSQSETEFNLVGSRDRQDMVGHRGQADGHRRASGELSARLTRLSPIPGSINHSRRASADDALSARPSRRTSAVSTRPDPGKPADETAVKLAEPQVVVAKPHATAEKHRGHPRIDSRKQHSSAAHSQRRPSLLTVESAGKRCNMFRLAKRDSQLAPPDMPTLLVAVSSLNNDSSPSDACHRSIDGAQATLQPQDFNIPQSIQHRGSVVDCDVDLYASRRSSTSENPTDAQSQLDAAQAPSIVLPTNTAMSSGDVYGMTKQQHLRRLSAIDHHEGEYWDTTMSDADDVIKDAMHDFDLKQQPTRHHGDAAGYDEEDIDAMIEEVMIDKFGEDDQAGSVSDAYESDVARLLKDDILEASHDSRRFSTDSRKERANATRRSVLRRRSGGAGTGESMVKLEGPLSRGLSYRRTSARGEQETSYVPGLIGKSDVGPQHEHGSTHHENQQVRETRRPPADEEPDEVQQYQELVDCLAAAKLDPRLVRYCTDDVGMLNLDDFVNYVAENRYEDELQTELVDKCEHTKGNRLQLSRARAAWRSATGILQAREQRRIEVRKAAEVDVGRNRKMSAVNPEEDEDWAPSRRASNCDTFNEQSLPRGFTTRVGQSRNSVAPQGRLASLAEYKSNAGDFYDADMNCRRDSGKTTTTTTSAGLTSIGHQSSNISWHDGSDAGSRDTDEFPEVPKQVAVAPKSPRANFRLSVTGPSGQVVMSSEVSAPGMLPEAGPVPTPVLATPPQHRLSVVEPAQHRQLSRQRLSVAGSAYGEEETWVPSRRASGVEAFTAELWQDMNHDDESRLGSQQSVRRRSLAPEDIATDSSAKVAPGVMFRRVSQAMRESQAPPSFQQNLRSLPGAEAGLKRVMYRRLSSTIGIKAAIPEIAK